MKLTKENLHTLREAVEQALEPVCKELDLQVDIGKMRYERSGDSCNMNLEFIAPDQDGNFHSSEMKTLLEGIHYGLWSWLSKEDVGKVLISPTLGKLKLVGVQSRSRKYPFIVELVGSGKQYKMTEASIRGLYGANKD